MTLKRAHALATKPATAAPIQAPALASRSKHVALAPRCKHVHEQHYSRLDAISFAIATTWSMIPPSTFDTDSLFELSGYSARFTGCTVSEAMERIDWMLEAGVLGWDGTVDPLVLERARQIGARVMGRGDEPVPASEPSDSGESGDPGDPGDSLVD